jgi:hypothetical protein
MEINLSRKGPSSHPDDQTLSSLIDDPATVEDWVRTHAAGCLHCSDRVERLRNLRGILQDVGTRELVPPNDLTPLVLGKLRMRQAAIGSMNEILAALRALLEGFSSLIGGAPPSSPSGHSDKGVPHG